MRIPQRRRGIATIWFAIVGLVLVGLFALAIDSAHISFSFHQLQVAADSSALSALDGLPTTTSIGRIHAINTAGSNRCDDKFGVTLTDNPSNAYGGDIVYGFYDITDNTFTRTTTNANAATVSLRRTTASTDGAVKFMFNFWSSQAGSNETAIATAFLYGPQPGLLLLDIDHNNGKDVLKLQGGANTDLFVTGGSILVNSNNAAAGNIHGTISATSLASVGTVTGGNLPPQVTMSRPVPDPVAPFVPAIPASVYTNLPVHHAAAFTNITNLPFGYWPEGLPTSGSHVLLSSGQGAYSGVFFIGGNWMPGGTYTGTGVTLYLLKPTSASNANLAPMTITAPTSGPFANVAIYQDPTPGSFVSLSYTGNPTFNITGTVYMPYTDFSAKGNVTVSSFGSEVIFNSLSLQGSASWTMTADPLFQVVGTQRVLINTQRTKFQ